MDEKYMLNNEIHPLEDGPCVPVCYMPRTESYRCNQGSEVLHVHAAQAVIIAVDFREG